MDKEIIRKYGDIINLPHHQSIYFSKMPIEDRAAQFSPFAALTTHEDAIKETSRLTDKFLEISEEEKNILNEKLRLLLECINIKPNVKITYFIPDKKKQGGKYYTVNSSISKFNELKRQILMSDKTLIQLDMIVDIDGDIFNKIIF